MFLRRVIAAPTTHFFRARMASILTEKNINPKLLQAEYAVRGPIVARAGEIMSEITANPSARPFKEIVYCNIGNPQSLHQKPVTFFRQVLALLDLSSIMDIKAQRTSLSAMFPTDVIDRVLTMSHVHTGAYSDSQGIKIVRDEVAAFLEERDGFKADPNNIFLTTGASDGIANVLNMIISDPTVGIMIPIPQYPLYSATITLANGRQVPYYLDEEHDWDLTPKALATSLSEARKQGTNVRCLCVINPGNPTGQVLSESAIVEVIKFAHAERLVLLVDEVYQTNAYYPKEHPFVSFRKVLGGMGPQYQSLEMFSFHSVSKGVIGECGRRGGYLECSPAVLPEIRANILKRASISLCSNVQGQVMVGLMVNPPKPGQPSYELYNAEVTGIYDSLKRRAEKVVNTLNDLEGYSCNRSQGAMYAFPRVRLPPKAVAAAIAKGLKPDEFYCLQLLEATGVCVVPGSGFQQAPGTHHFRTTFLPPENQLDHFLSAIKGFHNAFMAQYK